VYRGNKERVEGHGIDFEGCLKISQEVMPGSSEVKNCIWVDHLDPKENPELKAQR